MTQRRRRIYSRRRQQVRRQIFLLIMGAFLLVVVVNMLLTKYSDVKGSVREASVITGQGQKPKDTENTESPESLQNRLERVRSEARANGYPESVISLLDKNPETVDFVEGYGEGISSSAADTVGESITKGEIPLLLQWDKRWGYAPYGTSIVAVSGCGPTCMAMIISGLTGDASVTPAKMADYGTQNHYVDEENNTYWKFMREVSGNWGISCAEAMLDEERVAAELNAGHPIVCSVGPGDFTQNGHFIILTAYADGKVKVNDPFSRTNSEKEWVFADIKGQIKSMWVYSLAS